MAEPTPGPSSEPDPGPSSESASTSSIAVAPVECPKRGILKNSTSFDTHERKSSLKETKWDEMNIIATLHPRDKEYGHMKIEEPKTPYNYVVPEEDEDQTLDETAIAELIRKSESAPRRLSHSDTGDEEDEESLTEEQRAHKQKFRERRRSHYNEFHAVQLARELMAADEEEDGEGMQHSHATGHDT